MLVPLVILALLSSVGGWVGISQRFEQFPFAGVSRRRDRATPVEALQRLPQLKPERERPGAARKYSLRRFRSSLPSLGLFLAWLLYHRRPHLPQEIAIALGGLYEAVVHKYYVDELYASSFREAADRWLDSHSLAWYRSGCDRRYGG